MKGKRFQSLTKFIPKIWDNCTYVRQKVVLQPVYDLLMSQLPIENLLE